jgi:hypothetical protein
MDGVEVAGYRSTGSSILQFFVSQNKANMEVSLPRERESSFRKPEIPLELFPKDPKFVEKKFLFPNFPFAESSSIHPSFDCSNSSFVKKSQRFLRARRPKAKKWFNFKTRKLGFKFPPTESESQFRKKLLSFREKSNFQLKITR